MRPTGSSSTRLRYTGPSDTHGTTTQEYMGNLETSDTFAGSFTRPDETDDAFARPQCRKIKHFERAKVPTVSPHHEDRAALVPPVSDQPHAAPNRQAMYQFAHHDTHRATSATRPHWCGGCRRDRWAWPRCRWATAGPGRASRRRAETHTSSPVVAGVEGAGGSGGHGRASRSTLPSRRLACGDLAGGRARRRPEHRRRRNQHRTSGGAAGITRPRGGQPRA